MRTFSSLAAALALAGLGCAPAAVAPSGLAGAVPVATACVVDDDCADAQVCVDGVCGAAADVGAACSATRDCGVDDFCDAGRCAPLPEGLCRSDAHCAGRNFTFCGADAGTVGRCVECRADSDCESGACFDTGACAPAAPDATDCPSNSSPLAGTTTCRCDANFQPDASGACVPLGEAAPLQCVEHASPIPGVAGQCQCDAGFEPSRTGAACVVVGSQGAEPDPVDDNGNGAGGGGGGGTAQTSACGENAFPLFFLCVCFPGYVVDPFGDGCVVDESEPSDETPIDETPINDPQAPAATCPAHSSPDPTDDAYCLCDDGYVVNDVGDACEEDMCATLGYYGDGFYCDDFCALVDPDCSGGV